MDIPCQNCKGSLLTCLLYAARPRRLKCHPQGEGDRVGLYLCYPGAARTPPGSPHCPDTAFALTIKNHTDNDKAKAQGKCPDKSVCR